MHIGIHEISLIIIVLIALAIVARMFRAKPGSDTSSHRQGSEGTGRIRRLFRRTGIAFILVGAILLFSGIGLLKWAFQSYVWSLAMLVIGFAIIFLSRKK